MKDLSKYPLWTALITPFNEDESIDFESFGKLLKRQEAAGNGVLVLGSTGENLSLSAEEKKSVIEFTCAQNLSVPVMSGVGGTNMIESLNWIKYLETQAIDSYLLVTPLYTKPGEKGQYQWFTKLLDASTKPCVLYNIPSRTGKLLEHNAVKQLSSHPNFYGIKEASGSVDEFIKYTCDAPNAVIFSGDDGMLPQFALVGAKGLISVIANVWPKEVNCYTKMCINLKLDGVLPSWKRISEALFMVSNPIPAKVLLHHKGIIKTPKLRLPLTHEELKSMDELLIADKMVNEWTYSCNGWEK